MRGGKGAERGKWKSRGVGGVGGGDEEGATPEESDGCNDITITGNLPMPRAPEMKGGFGRERSRPPTLTPHIPKLPPRPRSSTSPSRKHIWPQEIAFTVVRTAAQSAKTKPTFTR